MNRRHIAVLIGVGIAVLMAVPAHAVRLGTLNYKAEINVTTIAEGAEAVKTVRGGAIHAVSIMSGTAPCTIIVYDSVNQAGATVANIKWEGRTVNNNETYSVVFKAPLMTDKGIFVQIQGVGAVGIVAFE